MAKIETKGGHSTRNRYGDKITTDAARLGDTIEPYLFGGHSSWLPIRKDLGTLCGRQKYY